MKALITARITEEDVKRLKEIFTDLIFAGWGVTKKKLSEQEMAEAARDVDALLIEFEPVTERVLQAARSLKFIACCRNEPEANVDVEAATRYGIPVISGAGRNAVSVAEFTFGLMLSLSRQIARSSYLLQFTDEITGMKVSGNDQLRGPSEWSLDDGAPFFRFSGPELHDKILGLVGFGTIGRVVARMAHAFGMRVFVYDPFVSESDIQSQANAAKVTLERLMAESDFVSLHAKVTPQTAGLINEHYLSMMKPSAYLINTARAAIMDYDALYHLLRNRNIAGAALDVFPTEPIAADNPFRTLDNVLLTPHLAGASIDIPKHHSRLVTDSLLQWFNGERPERLMNPQARKGANR